MVKILSIHRLFPPADVVSNLNVAHGRERGQQVELLKDKPDAMLPQPRALGVI